MDFRDFNLEVNGEPGTSFLHPAPLWPGQPNKMTVSFAKDDVAAACCRP